MKTINGNLTISDAAQPMESIIHVDRLEEWTGKYEDVVKKLGEPVHFADVDKVQVEWTVNTPAGVAVVYDYHSENYYTEVTGWQIAAHNHEAAEWVLRYLSL